MAGVRSTDFVPGIKSGPPPHSCLKPFILAPLSVMVNLSSLFSDTVFVLSTTRLVVLLSMKRKYSSFVQLNINILGLTTNQSTVILHGASQLPQLTTGIPQTPPDQPNQKEVGIVKAKVVPPNCQRSPSTLIKFGSYTLGSVLTS